jgi:hypothetical protein
MSLQSEATAFLQRVRVLSPQQRLLRATPPAATVLFLGAVVLAGGTFHPLMSLSALLLALVVAALPDSSAPMFLILFLGVIWFVSVPATLSGWVLVAALALLALHVGCALMSFGPTRMSLDGRQLRIWARRSGLLAGTAVLAWVGARLVSGLELPSGGLLLAVALALLLGWAALLNVRLARRS